MAYKARPQRFRKRFRSFSRPFRRFVPRRRRTTRRRPASKMKKYIMYGVIAFVIILIAKNKQKVTDFLNKLKGNK